MTNNIVFLVILTLFITSCGSSEKQTNNVSSAINGTNPETTGNDQDQENSAEQGGSEQQIPNVSPNTASTVSTEWNLVWHDEFEENDIDLTKWQFEVNCYGGGNDEKQCYTDRPENAFIEEGVLNIIAVKESFSGPKAQDDDPAYNVTELKTLPYTSARLRFSGPIPDSS